MKKAAEGKTTLEYLLKYQGRKQKELIDYFNIFNYLNILNISSRHPIQQHILRKSLDLKKKIYKTEIEIQQILFGSDLNGESVSQPSKRLSPFAALPGKSPSGELVNKEEKKNVFSSLTKLLRLFLINLFSRSSFILRKFSPLRQGPDKQQIKEAQSGPINQLSGPLRPSTEHASTIDQLRKAGFSVKKKEPLICTSIVTSESNKDQCGQAGKPAALVNRSPPSAGSLHVTSNVYHKTISFKQRPLKSEPADLPLVILGNPGCIQVIMPDDVDKRGFWGALLE